MNPTTYAPLSLDSKELAVVIELLESERTRLLVEINHTDHRAFRNVLHERLAIVEGLLARVRPI